MEKKKQGFIEEFFLWKISLYGFSLKMIEKAMEFFDRAENHIEVLVQPRFCLSAAKLWLFDVDEKTYITKEKN